MPSANQSIIEAVLAILKHSNPILQTKGMSDFSQRFQFRTFTMFFDDSLRNTARTGQTIIASRCRLVTSGWCAKTGC